MFRIVRTPSFNLLSAALLALFCFAETGFAQSAKNGKDSGGKVLIPDFDLRLKKKRAKSGELQISLGWNNWNDLDLHVVCPSGEKIYYRNRKSRCNGVLDVDMNITYRGRNSSDRAVENIYWPDGKSPDGRYKIYVHHYRNHRRTDTRDPTRFTVRLKALGKVKTFDGAVVYNISRLRYVLVHEFEKRGDKIIHDKTKFSDKPPRAIPAVGKTLLKTTGTLGPTSAKFRGKPCMSYTGRLVKGVTYQIDLESSQFDTYLYVGLGSRVVASNDDGGVGLNSRIVFTPTRTGTYEILAAGLSRNARGRFTLTVTQKTKK